MYLTKLITCRDELASVRVVTLDEDVRLSLVSPLLESNSPRFISRHLQSSNSILVKKSHFNS